MKGYPQLYMYIIYTGKPHSHSTFSDTNKLPRDRNIKLRLGIIAPPFFLI